MMFLYSDVLRHLLGMCSGINATSFNREIEFCCHPRREQGNKLTPLRGGGIAKREHALCATHDSIIRTQGKKVEL
jgi:hypothetical protein